MREKQVRDFLALPYTTVLRRDDDGDIVARIDELPGCTAHGKSESDALSNLREAMELWITERIEAGQPVPEPAPEEVLPSGKWVQRVPKSLHKKLSALAKAERVSLNQLVTSILAEAVGAKATLMKWTEIEIEDPWPAPSGAGWNLPRSPAGARGTHIAVLHVLGKKKGKTATPVAVSETEQHDYEEELAR